MGSDDGVVSYSNGKPCVVCARTGSIILKSDAVKKGDVWVCKDSVSKTDTSAAEKAAAEKAAAEKMAAEKAAAKKAEAKGNK